MIARAAILFVIFAGFIYIGIWFLANATLTAAKALKVVKIAGAIFISLFLAAIFVAGITSLDKLI